MATMTFNDLPIPPSDSHDWTSAYQKFLKAGDVQGYLAWLQANKPTQLANYQNTGNIRGTGSSGGTTGGTGGALPGLNPVPVGSPTPIMSAPLSYSGRFGSYTVPSYQIGTSYSGPETPGGSVPAPGGTATPPGTAPGTPTTPTPSPGSPSGSPSGSSAGLQPMGGPGAGGNNGGIGGTQTAPIGGNGGSFGSLFGNNTGSGLLDIGGAGAGLLDLGTLGSTALGMLGHMPGIPGLVAGGINLAGRAYNTAQVDSIRQQQGMPSLSLSQVLSGLTGIGGDYGSLGGGTTIANPEQFSSRWNAATQPMQQAGLFSSLGPFAETANGQPYNSFNFGPFALGTSTPALSYKDVNSSLGMLANLNNPTAGQINPSTGLPNSMTPAQYEDLYGAGSYAAPKPAASAPTAARSLASYSPITRSDGTLQGYYDSAGNRVSVSDVQAALKAGTGQINNGALGGISTGAYQTNGALRNDSRSISGVGTVSNPGGGTTAAGTAGTGGLNNGFGGGGYHTGGMVPGRPNGRVDDVPARLDQGEFVVQQPAAKAAGNALLAALNDPKMAGRLRILARQGGILGR